MKLLNCPHIGLRPVSEFSYGGEAIAEPDPDAIEQARSDVVDHLQAIKSIDLTKDKIGFEIAGGLKLARMLEVQCGY